MNTYGIIDKNNFHTDTSNTERGAKNYATRHGYDKVSIRYGRGYGAWVVSIKIDGKWVKV